MLATWLWVMLVGRDISWDVINHHLYLPFSLLSGRFSSDFFAAGPQSYQNPIGYLPFYGLVQTGAPSWLVGTGVAVLHGLAFWPLHRLTVVVWGDAPQQRWWRLMALATAGLAPIFLLLAGTSSVDPLSAVLVLGALALVLLPTQAWWPAAAAGGLMGLAFAVKPVTATFVIALAAVVVLRLATRQTTARQALACAAAAAGAALVFMGPWSWWLWQTFGNPVFPLFNHLFLSPYAPQEAVLSTRFAPNDWVGWLTRPFELASYNSFNSTEVLAPDIRPAAAVLLFLPAAVAVWRYRAASAWGLLLRADLQLVLFSAVAYVLWLATSGNARYAVASLMLVGVLLVRFAELTFPHRAARVVLGVLLLLQAAYYGVDGDTRIGGQAWDDRPFLQVRAPQQLVDKPFLHLSVGSQTFAGLAPHLHHGGSMINLVGQMSLPDTGPPALALRERLDRWQGSTRFLFRALGGPEEPSALPEPARARANALVARFGLRIAFDDCLSILVASPTPSGVQDVPIYSCAALPAPVPALRADYLLAQQAFANIEKRCPRVFGPPPMATDDNGDAFQRLYVNSNTRVTVSADQGVLVSHHRSMNVLQLGSAGQVAAGQGRDLCAAWQQLDVQQGRR